MEVWSSGNRYELYIGRWSRSVAREFLAWLNIHSSRYWLDLGCGTGALSRAILELASPELVAGIDASKDYVAYARQQVSDDRLDFHTGDAQQLPYKARCFDAAVSGLVLNFLPQSMQALSEVCRVVHPGGTVAIYVWDYAGDMQLIRYFWDAAVELDPSASALDEGRRFPICHPESLEQAFLESGLAEVEVRAIDVPTVFNDFTDYWSPFLGGQGPAPGYTMSLSEERRFDLSEKVRARLPVSSDGSIHLKARAWAARGRVEQ